jgi:glutamine synthetase
MNFKKTLLFYCDKILKEYGLNLMIGGELEFYCSSGDKLAKYSPSHKIKIVKETGENQFEIQTPVYFDSIEFINCIEQSKKELLAFAQQENIDINFAAKPFANIPGSSLHIHLNFLDHQKYNAFELSNNHESLFLLFSVGGLIKSLKESMVFFAPHKKCYDRYKKCMFTPLKIAWGNNNRTAAIRIITRANDVRRIEHRVPCSDADPIAVVTAIIVSIYHGLSKQILPPHKIYGNAFDTQYKLQYLPRTLEKAEALFNKSGYKNLFLK